jgi:hypothetical protein
MPTVTLRSRTSLVMLAAALLLTACSGAATAPTGRPASTTPAAATPTAIATPSAVPTPLPAASQAAAIPEASASGGPVDYAAWVERQGFGGSSGLNEVAKETEWMRDHPIEVTPFDIQTTQRFIDHLAAWLDQHPATACWADYHTTVRAALARMHDAYITAHDARAAGNQVAADVVAALVNDADNAARLAEPAGC